MFVDLLDDIPTFRSFLLQLVLRHDIDAGLHLIAKYLERTERVLERSRSQSLNVEAVRAELHNVIVQCIEQTYWAHSQSQRHNSRNDDDELSLTLAAKLLSQATNELVEQHDSPLSMTAKLCAFAKIHFGFEALADYIYTQIFTVPKGR